MATPAAQAPHAGRFVAAITVDAIDPEDAERLARAMYGWPGDRVTTTEVGRFLWHAAVYRAEVPTLAYGPEARSTHR